MENGYWLDARHKGSDFRCSCKSSFRPHQVIDPSLDPPWLALSSCIIFVTRYRGLEAVFFRTAFFFGAYAWIGSQYINLRYIAAAAIFVAKRPPTPRWIRLGLLFRLVSFLGRGAEV